MQKNGMHLISKPPIPRAVPSIKQRKNSLVLLRETRKKNAVAPGNFLADHFAIVEPLKSNYMELGKVDQHNLRAKNCEKLGRVPPVHFLLMSSSSNSLSALLQWYTSHHPYHPYQLRQQLFQDCSKGTGPRPNGHVCVSPSEKSREKGIT